ncbi:MAG TPA: hypothetical protein VIM58_06315 [Candidatus Methylacidiphilales bacterium]
MLSFLSRHRKALLRTGAGLLAFAVLFLALFAVAVSLAPARLAPYFSGPKFRDKISESTSRGLKVEGKFSEIHPDGWKATADSFHSVGRPGESIASLDAEGLAAKFNPWGFLRHRWVLDWVSIDRATLVLRTSDPDAKIPLPKKERPWYAFVLPKRTTVTEVWSDQTEVLWTFRGEPAGIHHIRLRLTPTGHRSWRFTSGDGSGLLEVAPLPPLRVVGISAILSKPWFDLEGAVLAPEDPADPGRLRLAGKAGLREDKTMELRAEALGMPLGPWLPPSWRRWLSGRIDGRATWDGTGTKLEHSRGDGSVRLVDATLSGMPLLEHLARFSGNPAFREVKFSRAMLDWSWRDPVADITHIALQSDGIVRLEGDVHVDAGKLSGVLRLGLRGADLKWLPKQGVPLFPEEADGYRWTTITLSGTVQEPKDDFSPRLRDALLASPSTLLKLGWEEVFGP